MYSCPCLTKVICTIWSEQEGATWKLPTTAESENSLFFHLSPIRSVRTILKRVGITCINWNICREELCEFYVNRLIEFQTEHHSCYYDKFAGILMGACTHASTGEFLKKHASREWKITDEVHNEAMLTETIHAPPIINCRFFCKLGANKTSITRWLLYCCGWW